MFLILINCTEFIYSICISITLTHTETETFNDEIGKQDLTRRAFASVRSFKIWVGVIIIIIIVIVIVTGENKVKSYFVGFAQNPTL